MTSSTMPFGRHDREACSGEEQFEALPDQQKAAILAFLRSL